MTAKDLFAQCSSILHGHYPDSMAAIESQVQGPGFFPGTSGSFHTGDLNTGVRRTYLVTGQDFGTVGYMAELRMNPQADITVGTGRTLGGVLREAGIREEDCFFTNVLQGVRTSAEISGRCEGWQNKRYVQKCLEAFNAQLEAVQPKIVICLGRDAPSLLKFVFSATVAWEKNPYKDIDGQGKAVLDIHGHTSVVATGILVHPSFRNSNVHRRSYAGKSGHEAELAILKHLAGKIATR